MAGSSNRSVVIISGLLTLLVLSGATLAVAFRNGWVTVAPAAAPVVAAPVVAAPVEASTVSAADQSEVAVYRGKLEEAYRALDESYAQVRTLQAAQSQVAPRGGDDDDDDDDDDDRPRSNRRRGSDDR